MNDRLLCNVALTSSNGMYGIATENTSKSTHVNDAGKTQGEEYKAREFEGL